MINVLRIISLIAAILAVVFFVFPIVYGVRSDDRVKEFLKTPEIREKFESATDSRINKSKDLTSPLVKQARAFASYLNPKSTVKKSPTVSSRSRIANALDVTPKFKLRCTSYYENDPNMSLALIDEPGKGRHWVRPSSKVGHLLIEEIKDGLIIVKGSEETFEIAIEESKVKDLSASSKGTSPLTRFRSGPSASGRSPSSISKPSPPARGPQAEVVLEGEASDENERDARAKALIDKLRSLQKEAVSGTPEGIDNKDKAARIERLISQYQSTRISPEEAKKLGNLGKTLKSAGESLAGDADSDPNRTPSNTGKSQ